MSSCVTFKKRATTFLWTVAQLNCSRTLLNTNGY